MAKIKEAEAGLAGNKRFSDETIKAIRADRAERVDDKIVYSHAALAKKYSTNPGTISQIVRNRAYKDPDYVPTNDGK